MIDHRKSTAESATKFVVQIYGFEHISVTEASWNSNYCVKSSDLQETSLLSSERFRYEKLIMIEAKSLPLGPLPNFTPFSFDQPKHVTTSSVFSCDSTFGTPISGENCPQRGVRAPRAPREGSGGELREGESTSNNLFFSRNKLAVQTLRHEISTSDK